MKKRKYEQLEILTSKELAEIFKVDESLILDAVFLNDGCNAPPAIFLGDEVRFLVSIVEDWINEELPSFYRIKPIKIHYNTTQKSNVVGKKSGYVK